MIRISCTNCKTVLSIDDAFAGGVCRCQHCGTIQTVPSSAREASAVGSPGQAMGGSKSLFQAGSSGGSRDLEELSAAVVSSGLTSSRLKRSNKPLIEQKSPNLMPIIVAAGVVIALLVVVIIFLMTRNSSTLKTNADNGSTPGVQTSGGSTSTVAAPNTPNFCTTPLTGNTVIYLIDCGQASKDCLGDLKDAVIKSARTLGSDRKFQILFWNNGTDGAYPESITTYATKESIDAAQKAQDVVFAYGQSDVKIALQKAISQHPDEIVLATGKGWDLDNAWLDSVLAIRGSSPAVIHCFNIDLGGDGTSAPLKRLAEKTGGTYHDLSKVQLHDLAQ